MGFFAIFNTIFLDSPPDIHYICMSKMNTALIKELEENLSKMTGKEFVREIESLNARTGYGLSITFNEYFGVK